MPVRQKKSLKCKAITIKEKKRRRAVRSNEKKDRRTREKKQTAGVIEQDLKRDCQLT